MKSSATAKLCASWIALFACLLNAAPALAETPPSYCPNPAVAPVVPSRPDRSGQPIDLWARSFDAQNPQGADARGDVELIRADQSLFTEHLRYLPADKRAEFPGAMIYRDFAVEASADTAHYSFLSGLGELQKVEYSFNGSTANGSAQSMSLNPNGRSYLRELQFTTCPGEEPQWQLLAGELELRHEDGYGIARHARLEFMDIPFLYLPWVSFPIDSRRKSGFLYPHFSSANDNGFEMGIPYYWNIAPNHDATFQPRYFTDRGFMLTGEYRMMTRRSSGQLEFDFLYDDKKTNRNRSQYKLRHNIAINRQWHTSLLVNRVSDDEYFQDFGLSLAQTARQYLHSYASINGGGRHWTFSLLADNFQVIDDAVSAAAEPYRRLPRIHYTLDRPLGSSGFQFGLDSEIVGFDRNIGTTGLRSDFYPHLGWGMDRYWGFFRANAGYRYTAYNLDLKGIAGDENPDRGTEIMSLDTGMYFERSLSSGKLQTLEPRFYYLYVPFENQDDLPDFDTAEFTFGFSQLFHTNRFTGADRQSDANRATVAVTTRSLDPASGQERWSLSMGQIFHFEEQRVGLVQDEFLDIDTSPLVAEYIWHPFTRFTGRLGVQWNWENRELDVGAFGLDYRSRKGSRVGFEYRFRRDRLDQFDFRGYWPVNDRWRVISRLKYSLEESSVLEAQAGIQYDNCCWAVRLITRRYLRSRDGDERDAIYLELNLKGLGSFGRQPPPLFYDEAE